MKVLVINGSPKGKYSITFQSIRYLQKHFPEINFETYHVGQSIQAIVKNEARFEEIISAARQSDCVLWCYPVYTFLVPYQLVKFIDLIFERGQAEVFAGKYSSQISTSKHFYDHTAHNYIHNISEDLDMHYHRGLSADMDDLTTEKGRGQLLDYAKELFSAVEERRPEARKYSPRRTQTRPYTPPAFTAGKPKTQDYKITLVTDCKDQNSNLYHMIQTYQDALPNALNIVNIADIDFKGGCLGCFHCAFEGDCIYPDGFAALHRENVLSADCVILAAEVQRHWFAPIWKCFDDRQFYNGHRTSMMGKSIGYIISGPLRQEPNLRQVLEGRSEVGQLYLLDIVSDEYDSDAEINSLLHNLAEKTIWAVEKKPLRPTNFLGVGGMKVFRDLIYVMRGLMHEDHRFYKKNGLYDFPQKQIGRILQMQALGLLLQSKRMRAKASQNMKVAMLKQYDNILERY